MHFLNDPEDSTLREQLVRAEIIPDGVLAQMIDEAKVEAGDLFEDVIMPNAEKFDPDRWIYWQVRELNTHRVNGLTVTPEFIEREGFDKRKCANFRRWQAYPIGRDIEAREYLVAVGRGEYLAAAKESLGGRPTLLAAVPLELAAIIKVYGSFAS